MAGAYKKTCLQLKPHGSVVHQFEIFMCIIKDSDKRHCHQSTKPLRKATKKFGEVWCFGDLVAEKSRHNLKLMRYPWI
jgi:CRISPR/Cas system-associated protein endoribonuclease Cas2